MEFKRFPLKGLNDIKFGSTPKEFIEVYGEPDEK